MADAGEKGAAASSSKESRPEWMQRRERGSLFWALVMCRLSLWFGRRLTRPILYGIALYFTLAVPKARHASRTYLQRALGRPAGWRDVYRHVLTFASTIHDRIYLLHGDENLFRFEWHGENALYASHARGSGLFLFGAHLGSFEAMRSLARANPQFKVGLAMYPDNAQQVNRMLAAVNPGVIEDVIALGQLDSMLRVHALLEEGAMVGILADRASGNDNYQRVSFLGEPAHFPTGPFRMAAMLRQPVFFMAGLYCGGNRYEIHFEQIADFAELRREERSEAVQRAVAAYAGVLEKHCYRRPYNWFNFFDFWESAGDDKE